MSWIRFSIVLFRIFAFIFIIYIGLLFSLFSPCLVLVSVLYWSNGMNWGVFFLFPFSEKICLRVKCCSVPRTLVIFLSELSRLSVFLVGGFQIIASISLTVIEQFNFLKSIWVQYVFLGICPFCVSFQVYWYKIIYRIPLISFKMSSASVLLSHLFLPNTLFIYAFSLFS